MFCGNCGKRIPDGARFCPGCGAPAPDAEPEPARAAGEEPGQKAPSGPGTAIAPARRRRRAPLVAAAVVLVAVVGVAAWLVLGRQDGTVTAEAPTSGTEAAPYEDFTVSDARVVTDGGLGPRVELTVTNNTDETVLGASFAATGSYEVVDEYGDRSDVEGALDLICWNPGSGGSIAYLAPGENSVTLLPELTSGVVASYRPKNGDEQYVDLEDVGDVEVEVKNGRALDKGTLLLSPADCGVELSLGVDGSLTGTITNNTDARWERAEVHVRALGPGGAPATNNSGIESNQEGFLRDLVVEYVKPGQTVDVKGSVGNVDPAEVEATYVVVTKDV